MRWCLGLLLLLGACGRQSPGPPDSSAYEELFVSPDSLRGTPGLVERVATSPVHYFRFVAAPFARVVCHRFADAELPPVILHGDAHVGQFAITDVGYGLDDFDAGCSGPPVIDLVRFATSIALSCRERGWQDQEREIIGVFLDRYLYALREGKAHPPRPDFVTRQLQRFPPDRTGFLNFVETTIRPVPEEEDRAMRAAFARFVDTVRGRASSPRFFRVKSMGRFSLGIGSARDRKYLWRIEGTTADAEDDVVLEMHEVRPLHGIACAVVEGAHPADRVLDCARALGRIDDPWRASVPLGPAGEPAFRIHTWQAHFAEVDVHDPRFRQGDLRALVEVVGDQLGSGHLGVQGSRLGSQRVAAAVEPLRGRVVDTALSLAAECTRAWQEFRRMAEPD